MSTATDNTRCELDLRTSLILKLVVERYLVAGTPVGSKTLAELPGMNMSSATVRNQLAALERAGLLYAPHTSAGRLPTADGLRVFLDRILVPAPLGENTELALRRQLGGELRRGREPGRVAAEVLAELSGLAAIVSLPQGGRRQLRQIEFIALQPRRVLAVLVFEPGEVENRLFELPAPISRERLQQVARQLTERYGGLSLRAVHGRLSAELADSRPEAQPLLGTLNQVLAELERPEPRLRIAGDRQLLVHDDFAGVEQIRDLFRSFEQKRQWLQLFEGCLDCDWRILLGEDSGVAALAGCGVITVPYRSEGQPQGVVAAVGPMRMNYAQAIPLVRAAAQALEEHLNPREPSPI